MIVAGFLVNTFLTKVFSRIISKRVNNVKTLKGNAFEKRRKLQGLGKFLL